MLVPKKGQVFMSPFFLNIHDTSIETFIGFICDLYNSI